MVQIKTELFFKAKHQTLYQDIFDLTQSLQQTYPDYKNWYNQTFLEGLKKRERGIIVALDDKKMIGCALIKNTPEEKKLCTLFVHPDYRRRGIAAQLLKETVRVLGEKPFVTVSENNKQFVDKLFDQFRFHLSATKKSVYLPNKKEYYFNDAQADAIQNKLIPVLIQRQKQLKKS